MSLGSHYTFRSFFTLAYNAGFTQKAYSVGVNVNVNSKPRLQGGVFGYHADQAPINGERHDLAYLIG